MSLLENWVQTPGAMALVWTLIHSLWEGALIALLLAVALCVFRGSRVRYAAACVALTVMLAGFGVTFARLISQEQAVPVRTGAIRLAPLDPDAGASPGLRTARSAADYLPWLAPFWMAGVLLFHLRSLAGWLRARRLRRTGVCRPPAIWQETLDCLAARLRISAPVTLWESCLTDVPLVIGFLRPVILMPVGLLAGLPAAQVEALLLHELAHIRRYDYVINLLLVFVEGLVFYHPAVWWIAGVIRAERENCCDDLVVATQGDAYQYATALAALEFNRGDAQQPALAANGGSLVKRIRRLLAQPETPRSALTPVLSAAVLSVTVVAVLTAWQTKPLAPPVPPVAPVLPSAPPTEPRLFAQAQRKTGSAVLVETPYRKWLTEDVAYIITDEERTAFRGLQSDPEREHFIEQFWLRRDPTPDSAENEYKEEHYRRIAYTNEHFGAGIPGWKTDRGRIYIVYGPPDQKESHPSGGEYRRPGQEGGGTIVTYPFEQWMYRWIEGVGKDVIVEFVDPTRTGEYRMTMDPNEKDAAGNLADSSGKPHVTVQILGSSAVISVPLGVYRSLLAFARLNGANVHVQDRAFTVVGRILLKDGAQVTEFEEGVQGPSSNYVKSIPLALGSYRLELIVKDVTSGKTLRQESEFEVR